MKKTTTKRFFLPLCLLMLFSMIWGGNASAQNLEYTLDFTTKSVKSATYTEDWTYTSNEISWTINGAANNNGAWGYVRTGGKTQKYSYYKSTAIIKGEISSIVLAALNIKNNNAFTMASIELTVASDANFSTVLDKVKLTDISTSMTFTPSAGNTWKDAYYKFDFVWKNTSTSKNYGMDVEKIEFYSSTTTGGVTAAFGQDNYTAAFGESAELTFTTNSDGEVSYSANPSEGITLTKTETGVTAVASKTGNYTITATVAATELYAETSVSCDLEVTKKDPEASMTIDPAVVEFGSTSTLTFRMKKGEATTHQVTFAVHGTEDFEGQLDNVAWSEDGDSHVATIHLTAPSNQMEYTFSATIPETDNYSSATASATLKVVAPSHNLTPAVLYKQITSMDEFVDGGVYLIYCESKKDAMGAIDAAKGERVSSSSITIQTGNDANGNEFNYYKGGVNAEGLPYEITITKATDGTYNLYHAEGKYINVGGGTNLSFALTGEAGWSISFVEGSGSAKIAHKTYPDNYIQRNSTTSYNYFKNYVKGQNVVYLYQKVGEINVHSKMKGYSTYVADFPYVMPAGLTGKTVSVDAAGQLTVTDLFEGGNEVPALTPLLVRTADTYAEGEEKKAYYPAVLTKEVTVADNVSEELANSNLEYRRKLVNGEKLTSTLNADLVNPYYYKLSVDTEGNNPGFYWGKEDGSAFVMKNGSTAYLTCSSAVRVNKFIFDENGETTAVEGVLTDGNMPADTVVYNLQGIRVNPKNLQKGIYIVNGRKTVVK